MPGSSYASTMAAHALAEEEAQQVKKVTASVAKKELLNQERELKRQEIEEWHKQKEQEEKLKRETALEKVKRRSEMEKKRELERRETKALVEEYRAIQDFLKEQEKLQEEEEQQRKNQSKAAMVDAEELRQRQMHKIEVARQKRLQAQERQRLAEKERQEALERMKAPVERRMAEKGTLFDADRLYRPTTSAQIRVHAAKKDKTEESRRFFTPGQGSIGVRALPPAR